MTTHAQFYLTRAAVARELAQGSKLDNVRESHLRAAETWDGFAARAMKADLMRAEEARRKSSEATTEDEQATTLRHENSAPEQDLCNANKPRGLSVY